MLREQVSTHEGAPLLPKLRGYFAEFLNNGYLERLRILSSSTCVGLRYGHFINSQNEAFLGSMGSPSMIGRSRTSRFPSALYRVPDLPGTPAYRFRIPHPSGIRATLLRPPTAQTFIKWCRNFRLLPIDYASRPRLRDRLTLGGLTLPRKP